MRYVCGVRNLRKGKYGSEWWIKELGRLIQQKLETYGVFYGMGQKISKRNADESSINYKIVNNEGEDKNK